MARLGADDVAVDELATTFDRTAARLVTSERTIAALVGAVAWTGPDADVFRAKWHRGMRAQMCSAEERLRAVAGELRKQAAAQRSASEGGLAVTGPVGDPTVDRLAEARVAAARRRAEAWADGTGRLQIRAMSDEPDEAQLAWWRSLTAAQRAALLRRDPGALYGLDGLPEGVRAAARAAYLDSVRADIRISSHEDKLAGELDIAWVHLGVEGTAAFVRLADGTYRVDLALDGEVGAKVGEGARAEVGVGAGVAQSYTFASQAEAEEFVEGLYDKLTPDVGWSILEGPGGVMADTVDDVVRYLDDHSAERTAFQGELELQGNLDLRLGGREVALSGAAGGARYDFDSHRTTAFLKATVEGELPVPDAPDGTTGGGKLAADLEAALTFDEQGAISALQLTGSVGGEANAGIERFLDGTTPASAAPRTFRLSAGSGATVTFDATLDLQDPIVQQRAAAVLGAMGSPGGVSMADLQQLMRESALQVQVDVTSVSSDRWDIGIASLEVSQTDTSNLLTWLKPPGGEFTYVSPGELTGPAKR